MCSFVQVHSARVGLNVSLACVSDSKRSLLGLLA